MKKLLLQKFIILSCTIFLLISCTKDPSVLRPLEGGHYPVTNQVPDSGIYFMKIDDWIPIPNIAVYTCTINMPAATASKSRSPQIKIYLVDNNNTIQINERTQYEGGSIWTVIEGSRITFYYRDDSGRTKMPFTFLNIKLEMI